MTLSWAERLLSLNDVQIVSKHDALSTASQPLFVLDSET